MKRAPQSTFLQSPRVELLQSTAAGVFVDLRVRVQAARSWACNFSTVVNPAQEIGCFAAGSGGDGHVEEEEKGSSEELHVGWALC